jgi:predicted nucleic acid-binding protein
MNGYLLDTNVISELRKFGSGKCDAKVEKWIASIDADATFISVVTLLEIEYGIVQIEQRDAAQGALLRAWFEGKVLPEYRNRMLPIDAAVARRCVRLHIPNRRSEMDVLIAATALVHDLTVVTRNARDFTGTGARIVNPWE